MTSLRLLVIAVLTVLTGIVVLGCSVQPSRTHIAVDSAAVAAATADYDQAQYCDVLGTALEMTPQGAVNPSEAAAFADALDGAAEVAKLDHRPTLRAIADINRSPEDLRAARAYSMINRSIPIYRFASEECGITVPGVTVNEDGSVSFSSSFSVSSSISITGSVNENASELELEESSGILPTGPGSASALDLAGSTAERLAGLNAAVESSRLVFETTLVATDEDGGYDVTAASTAGWPLMPKGLFGLEASGAAVAPWLAMQFESSCQGICSPQSWDAVMQDPERSPFRVGPTDAAELLLWQELSAPAGLLMVQEFAKESFGRKVEIVLVRWDDNVDKFFTCTVVLPSDVSHLWAEFAHACALAEPLWFS